MPNRLTLLYFKIYYKKENYLKVRTIVFKYINSSIVTDLINRIVQVLKRDLYWFKISTRDAGLIKPVKL